MANTTRRITNTPDLTRRRSEIRRAWPAFRSGFRRWDRSVWPGFSWIKRLCFGDGTYALSDYLDDAPAHAVALHQYILYAGANYRGYQYLTTGILLAVYFFLLWGAAKCLRQKAGSRALSELAPRLAALGLLVFLLFWETSGRYFTNFVPLMLVCAVLSLGGEKRTSVSRKIA